MTCSRHTRITLLLLAGTLTWTPSVRAACPTSPTDTVVPLASLDPPPAPGKPGLTITALDAYIRQNNIANIMQLLTVMPDHVSKNFSLVEVTRTPGRSSLQFPRMVLFGADARFMANVATDPSDPDYEKLDTAYMNKVTGEWEFAQFDFTTSPMTLRRNPPECAQCHGTPARPFWGTYLDWPGLFGDDPTPGEQPERLTPRHAQRFRELKAGQGNPQRFHAARWANSYADNGSQFVPEHDYGFAMTLFNQNLAFAVTESAYLRMKRRFPARFTALREELILLGYCSPNGALSATNRQRIATLLSSLGVSGATPDSIFSALGLNRRHEFSLDKLSSEVENANWNTSVDSLDNMFYGLVLNDLVASDPNVRSILQNGPNNYGIYSCPNLGRNTLEVLQYKMLHGWQIRGEARSQRDAAFYEPDMPRMGPTVFAQVRTPLCSYLATKIDTSAP